MSYTTKFRNDNTIIIIIIIRCFVRKYYCNVGSVRRIRVLIRFDIDDDILIQLNSSPESSQNASHFYIIYKINNNNAKT